MKHKVCVVTGTRAEYGLLKPIIDHIKKHSKLDLALLVTGMHLLDKFGKTINEIEKDGHTINAAAEMYSSNDNTPADIAKAIGTGIINITKALATIKPDVMLILGDRAEAFAAAIAATYLEIPIMHIHGGDQSENGAHIDDIIRPTITKLAHIHCAATKNSAERILKVGENPNHVFITGSPAIDGIKENLLSKKEIEKLFDINLSKPLLLVVQHATPEEADSAGQQMTETLAAIKELALQTIIIYPNNDPGSKEIISTILKYKKMPLLKIFKNIPRKEYLSLLNSVSVMIGNSSSGTIEAPSFQLPVVNIGTRESKREHAINKIFVPHDKVLIKQAIEKAMSAGFKDQMKQCTNPYGDGNAVKKIIDILTKTKLDKNLLRKVIR